jgi:segregation and condensation protein B
MNEAPGMPELKQILGSMIFGASRPLKIRDMRNCLVAVAQEHGEETAVFLDVKDSHIRDALTELGSELEKRRCGFVLREVAGGYRFQSDAVCGRWLKHLLEKGKGEHLSRPSLETLAIIAYRQPITRADIESVRGVSVDHVVKALMELQLVRIVGRSELPGRPFLYGTTHAFLSHFGLRDLKELGDMEPMLARHAVSSGRSVATSVSEADARESVPDMSAGKEAGADGHGEANDGAE